MYPIRMYERYSKLHTIITRKLIFQMYEMKVVLDQRIYISDRRVSPPQRIYISDRRENSPPKNIYQ